MTTAAAQPAAAAYAMERAEMSDVRGLLTETLTAHVWGIYLDDNGIAHSGCTGCKVVPRDYEAHLADVLLAGPVHIVGRVEPDWTSEGRYAARWDMDGDTVRLDCFGHIEGVMGETYTRAEARTLAAILLSAAATAEEAV